MTPEPLDLIDVAVFADDRALLVDACAAVARAHRLRLAQAHATTDVALATTGHDARSHRPDGRAAAVLLLVDPHPDLVPSLVAAARAAGQRGRVLLALRHVESCTAAAAAAVHGCIAAGCGNRALVSALEACGHGHEVFDPRLQATRQLAASALGTALDVPAGEAGRRGGTHAGAPIGTGIRHRQGDRLGHRTPGRAANRPVEEARAVPPGGSAVTVVAQPAHAPADVARAVDRKIREMLAAGRSNREISASVFLAEGTVKRRVAAICRELGVENRVQAAVRITALLSADDVRPSSPGLVAPERSTGRAAGRADARAGRPHRRGRLNSAAGRPITEA